MKTADIGEAVTRYLFNHRQDLMTDDERQAAQVALWQEKAQSASGSMKEHLWCRVDATRTPATDVLLSDGQQSFRTRVRERILSEHGDAVLNRCPRCNGLCNTPRAKQCPVCFHDWH